MMINTKQTTIQVRRKTVAISMENVFYCTFMAPRKYHQTNSPVGRDPHNLGRLILLLHCSASTMNLTKFQIAGKKKFSPECDIKSRNSAQSSSRGAKAEDPEGPGTVMIQSETSAVNCPRFPWSTGKYKYPRMTSFFRCPSNGAMLQRNKFPHISYTGECLQPTFLRPKASRKGAKLSDLFVLFEKCSLVRLKLDCRVTKQRVSKGNNVSVEMWGKNCDSVLEELAQQAADTPKIVQRGHCRLDKSSHGSDQSQ